MVKVNSPGILGIGLRAVSIRLVGTPAVTGSIDGGGKLLDTLFEALAIGQRVVEEAAALLRRQVVEVADDFEGAANRRQRRNELALERGIQCQGEVSVGRLMGHALLHELGGAASMALLRIRRGRKMLHCNN